MKNFFKKLKIKRRLITWLAGMHFYGGPSKKMKIVGVTGTNGKTTTTTLLYKVATGLGYKAGLIGTVENMIAGEVRSATHTTPDPIFLYKLLNEMAAKGCEYVFMEVSSHALDQNRIAGIRFAGAVFTNLTHDHLDYHKNMERYFASKKKIFKTLSPLAFALANNDDAYGVKILENIKAKPVLYGFQECQKLSLANVTCLHGEIRKMNFDGLELNFNGENLKSKLLGKFNAYNLLAVWSASSLLGFDMKKVNKILENITPPRGRFEHFMAPNGVLVIVDYAHSPDALEKILLAAKDIIRNGPSKNSGQAKLISLFGCGGDRDPMKRPIMGNLGATLSDIAIFTSDNPRSEDPDKIITEMAVGLSHDLQNKVIAITDRREAIKKSIDLAKEGDVILCAGKGHEDYQEIKGVKHHFNDLEEYKKLF